MCRIWSSTSIYVKNHPDKSLRKLRLLNWLFRSATYEMYEHTKSEINISHKLECFKRYTVKSSSLYLTYKCI